MRRLLIPLVVTSVFVAGCLESPPEAPEDPVDAAAPEVPPLPEVLSGLESVATLPMESGGNGVWIDEDRDLLFASAGGAGLYIFDIRDPANAVEIDRIDGIYARDVDLTTVGNRHLAVLSAGGEGIHVVDVTDPVYTQILATANQYASHNLAVVPGTPYVYNSQPVGLTDHVVPVLDLTDPAEPVWHTFPVPREVNGVPVTSDGCHDITVRVDLGRAYCGGGGTRYEMGGGEAFIWDISQDVLDPEWIGIVDNPFVIYHHQALADPTGNLLMLNDEWIRPNCNRADVGPVLVQQPTAALWFYDISDPANPELLSWLQPPDPGQSTNCGSHFGDLIDDRPVVSWGWYQGGTLLVDYSDPRNPVILDQAVPEGSTWDARYHDGHVYGSSGGVQVFRVV